MTTPNIALCEAAQTLCENWELVKNSNFLHPTMQNDMENLLAPMHQSLTNLDAKDKSSNATNQDMYQVIQWCFADPDLDASLSAWMQESAAFFVLLTQLRAIRGLVSNPQVYATKLVNDTPEATQFKKDKTISSIQQMLMAMCAATPTTAPSSRAHVRALAQLVDPSGSSSGLQPPDVGGSNIESTGLHRPVSPTHGSQVPVMPTPGARFLPTANTTVHIHESTYGHDIVFAEPNAADAVGSSNPEQTNKPRRQKKRKAEREVAVPVKHVLPVPIRSLLLQKEDQRKARNKIKKETNRCEKK